MLIPSAFTATALIFCVTFAWTAAAVNRKPSSEAESVEFGSTNKEERQFDFNRENYDPYDAQASAVAFRRYKEAQALKDGQVSSIHGATVHEDALPAASGPGFGSNSDDKTYEKKFYDPFFYFNGQRNGNGNDQYPQPSSSGVSASRRHGRLAHYQQTPIYAMPLPLPIRSRRNTGTTASSSTVSDGIDNNLLTEDVYFFRRDPDRNKQRLAEFEKSPYFYRESQSAQIQPEERQFPVSRSPQKEYFAPSRARINDQYFSRLEQQPMRFNANFGARPAPAYYQQYQPQSHRFGPIDHNGVDVDGPRIRDRGEFSHSSSVPRTLNMAGAGASGLPGINGWAVQVGTQLRVHDDGRTRHPHRYYVKDEIPRQIARYPSYSTDRQRQ